jgi:formamidopyrimidine-DNA glycosylase
VPELPEVETVVRDLRPAVTGRRIVAVPLAGSSVIRHPGPGALALLLPGAVIEGVERLGKYILMALGGEGRAAGEELVVHLGMTGHLCVREAAAPTAPHTHLRLLLDDGRELRYDDARRFGRILLGERSALRALGALPRLGVEPLGAEFTAAHLDALLRRTTRTVKAALLDQRGVAGLGNIYVDEVCHRAAVRPARRCHRLTRRERAALHAAVVSVLEAAIRNRGSSVDDYRDLWDARGSHQDELRVYGRGGQPCLGCGRPLRRTVVAGRGTTYCPTCQR